MLKCLNVKMAEEGVSLYLALMIMFILVTIGLGITVIVVSQMKMVKGMGDSVVAFFAADTGIEKTIFYDNKVIPGNIERGLCDICNNCPGTDCINCSVSGTDCDFLSGFTCTDCTVTYYTTFNGERYDVEAVVSGGATTIKSSGSYKGTKRAIEIVRLPPPLKAFLTSQRFTGQLGGLSGADSVCQTLANNAGLTGTYKAWLSDSTTSPVNNPNFTKSPGPYVRIDGVRIADNWDDLIDGSLRNPIMIAEDGTTPGLWVVTWTNTNPGGTVFSSLDHCSNWTTDSDSFDAEYGYAPVIDSRWTIFSTGGCSWQLRLYCFEQ